MAKASLYADRPEREDDSEDEDPNANGDPLQCKFVKWHGQKSPREVFAMAMKLAGEDPSSYEPVEMAIAVVQGAKAKFGDGDLIYARCVSAYICLLGMLRMKPTHNELVWLRKAVVVFKKVLPEKHHETSHAALMLGMQLCVVEKGRWKEGILNMGALHDADLVTEVLKRCREPCVANPLDFSPALILPAMQFGFAAISRHVLPPLAVSSFLRHRRYSPDAQIQRELTDRFEETVKAAASFYRQYDALLGTIVTAYELVSYLLDASATLVRHGKCDQAQPYLREADERLTKAAERNEVALLDLHTCLADTYELLGMKELAAATLMRYWTAKALAAGKTPQAVVAAVQQSSDRLASLRRQVSSGKAKEAQEEAGALLTQQEGLRRSDVFECRYWYTVAAGDQQAAAPAAAAP